jgi:two-component system, OmpR family, KDP operon response regulator KdpE
MAADAAARRPLRILSVEDEPLNRALLRASLARARKSRLSQAEFVEAPTLREARRLVTLSHYDLVLLDRRLPDGDGFQLARELTAMPAARRPVVVALTADAIPETREAASAAGCAAVLIKPFRPSELISLIEEIVPRAPRR